MKNAPQKTHAHNRITTTPQLYKEDVGNLSSSNPACVGNDMLPETDHVPVPAQKLVAKMQTKLNKVIADAKQALREAISTAEKTREPGPLVACRDELVQTAKALKQSCYDETNAADDLLKQLRDEERRKRKVGWFMAGWLISDPTTYAYLCHWSPNSV